MAHTCSGRGGRGARGAAGAKRRRRPRPRSPPSSPQVPGARVSVYRVPSPVLDDAAFEDGVLDAPLATRSAVEAADVLILGAPSRQGAPCGEMRLFLDSLAPLQAAPGGPALRGRVGAAFTSGGGAARGPGGAETVLASLHAWCLHHAMVVAGNPPSPAMAGAAGATPLGAVVVAGGAAGGGRASSPRRCASATPWASGRPRWGRCCTTRPRTGPRRRRRPEGEGRGEARCRAEPGARACKKPPPPHKTPGLVTRARRRPPRQQKSSGHPTPPAPSSHFFLFATVLARPLRVRALVLVRCPRTGRLLMWRRPR